MDYARMERIEEMAEAEGEMIAECLAGVNDDLWRLRLERRTLLKRRRQLARELLAERVKYSLAEQADAAKRLAAKAPRFPFRIRIERT